MTPLNRDNFTHQEVLLGQETDFRKQRAVSFILLDSFKRVIEDVDINDA